MNIHLRIISAADTQLRPTICLTCGQKLPMYVVLRAGEYRWGLCRRCAYELSHGLRKAIAEDL